MPKAMASLRLLLGALSAYALPASAQSPTAAPSANPDILIPYEAVNPREPAGDRLGSARRIAAAIVANDRPQAKLVVDVGSFTGEFLEAFMDALPKARGQWTEPVENNRVKANRRLGRFGDRIDYKIGCPGRDISLGCVPGGVDILVSSWISIHQNGEGIKKFYQLASDMVPSGGWVVNLDHIGFGGAAWETRLSAGRSAANRDGLVAMIEGPPVHHPDYKTPTIADHYAALKAAGFDAQVVWQRFDTVLIMGRKN
ncbi:hypothetical protein [Sphingobium boeckii]|uniref:Methyltransferase n=1 Tax=Sphingobium boeckii TaxID=1082345 RepID=A0A7W9ALP3_9SPHN|nr:hypothetical protein [Sphingobium boeckii]MBB5687762.1 hypothetical protein [Sphingobium boeckii]